ncbi:hypothetical protein GGR56DRAFT_7100 [Xylariaceae sp. FL0804]|nr:hypothetical protein GGR56DRAFT_7100 [Xylariaceae sp. FL0804]
MGSVNVATPYSPWPMGEQQPSTAQVFQQSRPSVFAQTPHVNNSAGYVAVSTQADEEVPQAQAQSHHNSSHSLTLAQPSSPPQGWQSTGTSLTTPPMHSTAGHAAAAMQAEEATPPYQHHSGSSPDLIRLARPSVAPQGWQYTGVGPTTPQQQPSSRPSMGSLTPSRQSQQFGSHSSSPVPAHQQQQQQQWTSQPHLGSATPPS